MAEYRVTGLSPEVIAELVAEVGPLWHEQHQARLAARPRQRAVGAGAKHKFAFVDRLPATLVSLRHGTTHDVLACWFGVDRSTITRAIGEVRPLLAQRGCTIAPDVRLGTLAEVVEYLGVDGRTGIIDCTEIRVRRPAAGRKDRDKFHTTIRDDGQERAGDLLRRDFTASRPNERWGLTSPMSPSGRGSSTYRVRRGRGLPGDRRLVRRYQQAGQTRP
ncbi:transposase family protein [Streptomyces sp. NPDC059627]